MNGFVYQYNPASPKAKKSTLITLWSKEARPAEVYTPKPTTVTVTGQFKTPVFVDLITGKVYEIPKNQSRKSGNEWTFTEIPVPDYPVLIADKSTLNL